MKQYILYVDREDVKEVEAEERNNFIKFVLESIGLELDEIWPENNLTVEDKIKLRAFLKKFDIQIIEQGGDFNIYVDRDLVGKWYKPFCRMKIDHSELDPSKRLFLEMNIKCESVFDENAE